MKNIPNREEQQIIECLKIQGFDNIKFEPDGNVPPDLLLNGKIAIEVRRLNQNQLLESGIKGLEQDEITVYGILNRIMDKASDKEFEKSAFVSYSFSRPLPDRKEIKKKVSSILMSHKACIYESREYEINERFQLNIFPSTQKLDRQFQIGGSHDDDGGGFVVGLIYDNLKLIITEKESKIEGFKSKYSEWWLAVVDTIGYGLRDSDVEQFYNLTKIESQFDKILLVSPLNASKFRFLYE